MNMKFNFLSARSINVVVGVFVVLYIALIVVSFLPVLIKSDSTTISMNSGKSYMMDRFLEPIDPLVPETISHQRFRQLTDSIKHRRQMKNGTQSGGSARAAFIGAISLERCEDCSIFEDHKPKVKEHFVSLYWWTLDTVGMSEPTKYYVKNGKPYLRKTICKLKHVNGNSEQYDCNEVDVALPFRYDTSGKSMLIPISKQTVATLNIALLCLMWLFVFYVLYYIIGGFIKVLLEIAAGTPFSDRNVQRLKRITLSVMLIPLALFILNLSMRLIFYKYFTTDIKLSADAWATLWKPVVLSVIFAALYFAFKQGKKLKEEQDLTV